MSGRLLQPVDIPLAVEDVLETLRSRIYNIGFLNENGDDVYPTDVEFDDNLDIIMEMSDGTRFKISAEEM